jgi:hypothetical protein
MIWKIFLITVAVLSVRDDLHKEAAYVFICDRSLLMSELRALISPCLGPVYSAAAPKKMRLTLPLVKSKMMPP